MERNISFALVRQLVERVPLVLKTAALNILRLSPAGGKQDLRLEVTVGFIRSFLNFRSSALQVQKRSMRDPGKKGYMWTSAVTMPKPPEDNVRQSLLEAIEHYLEGSETYDVPAVCNVEAEWNGYRKGAHAKTPLPDLSEAAKYERLMEDVDEDLTILYFHGGAYHMMDPCTHRGVTTKLAKLTGGRCFSVRYRLAPQNPFPAALLDALIAYLSLLSPPEGALHDPVPAHKIVIAGDSAGAGLSLALIQTLLTLRRLHPQHTIRFHGKDVLIELPAGLALSSPYCDITRSLPSTFRNAKYDYIIPPPQTPGSLYTPYPFPADATWPVTPPRVEFYANANMFTHPLISPVAAPKDIWKDMPPIYMHMGEESLEDEGLYLARNIHRVGGTVVLERFEAKPHCFALIMPTTKVAKMCFRTWAQFCTNAVKGEVQRTGKATFFDHTMQHVEKRDLDTLGDLSEEEVQKRILEGKNWRMEGEAALVREWKECQEKAKL
ncbi:predicted protein [Uncinocarpus reesii 1704]|uniref:Alpha/beta hydrolase fold-3 domain-containing protein n=1 Tax=Uncinocarpus reesii (strain UAMH 1704) TaxID=336963 RepID=C4JZ30_UNCRE|nr:uncharacterized protein UREG_07431 [Uncinocarpus reesii 1704]EEP82566.1 predicted protein [Uncinocarpus reesii 1704]